MRPEWYVALCSMCHELATGLRKVAGVASASSGTPMADAVDAYARALPRMLTILQDELGHPPAPATHPEPAAGYPVLTDRAPLEDGTHTEPNTGPPPGGQGI